MRSDGSIYFTDPYYGRMPGFGVERPRELGFQGVFRVPPHGGELQLVVDRDLFEQPNGLCFSPDEKLLYVNDSAKKLIRAFTSRPTDRCRASVCSQERSSHHRRAAVPMG